MPKPMRYQAITAVAIMLACLGLSACESQSVQPQSTPQNAADEKQWLRYILEGSWQYYQNHHMANHERVISATYHGTISEGQSYALLQSVWMNSPDTFEKTWRWTQQHLQRRNHNEFNDHLFAWQWGQREDGSWGVTDWNNATDADQDIAYALLLAAERWNKPAYFEAAQAIIDDLWTKMVRSIHGRYYLAPGSWDQFTTAYGELTIDPSYMAPYVYRYFARHDKARAEGWQQLADDVYPALEACSNLSQTKLPPNWCAVSYQSGAISFSDLMGEQGQDFGWDAVRVFWRMGMDAQSGSKRATTYLRNHRYLLNHWEETQTRPTLFSASGKPYGADSIGPASSALLAQNHLLNPSSDRALYQALLGRDYHPEGFWFSPQYDYAHAVIWLHLWVSAH